MKIHIEAFIAVSQYLDGRSTLFTSKTVDQLKDNTALKALAIIYSNIDIRNNTTTCKQTIIEKLEELQKKNGDRESNLGILLSTLTTLVNSYAQQTGQNDPTSFQDSEVSREHSREGIKTLGKYLAENYDRNKGQLRLSDADQSCVLQVCAPLVTMYHSNAKENRDSIERLWKFSDGVSIEVKEMLQTVYHQLPEMRQIATLAKQIKQRQRYDHKKHDEESDNSSSNKYSTPYSSITNDML